MIVHKIGIYILEDSPVLSIDLRLFLCTKANSFPIQLATPTCVFEHGHEPTHIDNCVFWGFFQN